MVGSARRRGENLVIELLRLLISVERDMSVAEAIARLSAARASFYRTLRILCSRGIVACPSRGWMSLGSLGMALAGRREDILRSEDQRRLPPQSRKRTVALYSNYGRSPNRLATQWAEAPVGRRPRFRIGFSNADLNNLWRVALVHSVEFGAVKYRPFVQSLTVKNAGGEAERQVQDIRALLDNGIDGLIVSAFNGPALAPSLAEARQRGVPVVLVDRGDDDASHVSFVSCDDELIGRVTALWLAEKLEQRGDVLLLPGAESAPPARSRLVAAKRVFDNFPNVRVIDVCWSDWRPERARSIVDSFLSGGVKIDGVWCDSGLQAVGALKAFIATEQRIPPHTGGDLNQVFKLAIRHRAPLAAVDYPPAMGLRAMEVLLDFLRGRSIPTRINVPTEIVVTRGDATPSVRPDLWADEHVRWDLPDDLILASGLGHSYDPRRFRVNYVGTRYNRSAAKQLGGLLAP